MTCTGICLVLSGVNYWGYYKCSKGIKIIISLLILNLLIDQQKKMTNLIRNAALDGIRKGFGFGF